MTLAPLPHNYHTRATECFSHLLITVIGKLSQIPVLRPIDPEGQRTISSMEFLIPNTSCLPYNT